MCTQRSITTIVLIKLAIWNLCVTSSRTSAAPSLQETIPSAIKIEQQTCVSVFKPVSQFSLDQVAEERRVEEDGEPEDDKEAGDDGQQEQPEPCSLWIINWILEFCF